ncbi:hypothetical protein G9A89_004178 [Geosiphon pyriformis]|nr:hypothetical protein G9A89_004178 [Geosiphon pyriformis]
MTSEHLVTSKEEQGDYAKSVFRDNLKGLNAFARHQKFINDYVLFYGRQNLAEIKNSQLSSAEKTELDILKENHQFLRSTTEIEEDLTWEQRIAKKYYNKLFKEYCIAELKYYKEGKIALRWRIEKEVISGKGQFECSSTRCSEKKILKSWEVNFAYIEDGEKKSALVKIRLCPNCSEKLNYKNKYREVEIEHERHEDPAKKHRKREKEKRRHLSKEEEENSEGSEPIQHNGLSAIEAGLIKRRRLDKESHYQLQNPIPGNPKSHHGGKPSASTTCETEKRHELQHSSGRTETKEDGFEEFFTGLFN